MSFVYNDKAWQIVEYKNLYYIELYTRSIRVYNQSFDQILKRDNPQYYYAQILVVEDTLFAMGKDTTFIDVLKIPSLELVKRIKWNEERYFVRSESTNMIYNKQEQLVYSGLYSDKKDTAVLTIIHINEDYREEVVWQSEHTYLLQILYNKRKKITCCVIERYTKKIGEKYSGRSWHGLEAGKCSCAMKWSKIRIFGIMHLTEKKKFGFVDVLRRLGNHIW